jgi:hypothetical protein
MFRTYVPVLACVALAVGGCGGDDDEDPSAGGPPAEKRLTKAEYVAQANGICSDTKDAQKEFDDKADDLDRDDLPAAAPIIEDALKVTRAGYERLKALSPPAADQARVDAYLAAVDRLLDSRDQLTEALRDDDRTAARKHAATGGELYADQKPLAAALDLDDCRNIF